MKTIYFIKNSRPRLPLMLTAVTYLMLDKFNTPGWAWGVAGTILLVLWILCLIAMVNSKGVDIWEILNSKHGITVEKALLELEKEKHKKSFQEKMNDKMKGNAV